MGEWITEYATDFEGIFDGTYCFEHRCPPSAQGLAQTDIENPIAQMANSNAVQFLRGLVNLRETIVNAFNGVILP